MYLRDASVRSVSAAVAQMKPAPSDCLIVLLAEDNAPDISALASELRKLGHAFIGAIVPRLIEGAELHSSGALLLHLPCVEQPFAVTGLYRERFELPPVATRIAELEYPSATAFILVDGLTRSISAFLSDISSLFGNTFRYLGGGAGYSDLSRKPCLFTQDGPLTDAALVLVSPTASRLGVRHGWEHLMGPVVATRTERNVIQELNWRNAFEVYREIVSEDMGEPIARADFTRVSLRYPFGVMKEGEEDVVRDPISVTPSGELVCVGEIPENAALSILRGKPESLIAAAGTAARECFTGLNRSLCCAMIVDCVARYAFLGRRFSEELGAVMEAIPPDIRKRVPIEGFLSLGEVASHGDGLADFLNKTIVVGAFHE